MQYIYIAGSDSVPNGGSCAPAVAGATHNWNGTEFKTCVAGGELTVTLNAWSLTPYTGASCGWSAHLNAMLYACALADIDLQGLTIAPVGGQARG